VLTLKVLRVAGKYSYGMYVYHLFVFLPFRDYWKNRLHSNNGLSFPIQLLMMLIEVVVVFVIAKLSYDLFETRFLLLKKYFEPAPRIAPAVTQSQILR
jgi:peptidoglycan/LPS O-acetylase OafA/YrhL